MRTKVEEDVREVKYQCIYRPTKEKFEPKKIDILSRAVYGDFDGEKYDYCYYSLSPNGYGDAWLRQFTGCCDSTKWGELTEEERSEWLLLGNLPSEWNGNEIYEGDILDCTCELLTNFGSTRTGKISTTLYEVIWKGEGWGKRVLKSNSLVVGSESNELGVTAKYSKVIGNIYSNSELLI